MKMQTTHIPYTKALASTYEYIDSEKLAQMHKISPIAARVTDICTHFSSMCGPTKPSNNPTIDKLTNRHKYG
jgi:hypothetical protein